MFTIFVNKIMKQINKLYSMLKQFKILIFIVFIVLNNNIKTILYNVEIKEFYYFYQKKNKKKYVF